MPSRSRVKFKSSKQVLPVNSFICIYRVHSLEIYSIFSTSTAIDQKTRSVHIYGHLNTYYKYYYSIIARSLFTL